MHRISQKMPRGDNTFMLSSVLQYVRVGRSSGKTHDRIIHLFNPLRIGSLMESGKFNIGKCMSALECQGAVM